LKNVWYAIAISDNVGSKPIKIQLCGKEMVLWRDQKTGAVNCIDNACPHRGAPLSSGWVEEKEGHSCISCGYHGWSFDKKGALHDVPAAANKGEWPKRSLMDSYPVIEKGGFIWLFYGSTKLPADARPPIPVIPELEDPTWKPVFEEIEFDANHFGVFENAIDMAHIHYLHNSSFGNQDAPEIRDMHATSDAFSVTAKFKIQNKPVNAFWALFKVPVVEVTAIAYLPSTSVVSFTLANGLSFITFVNTVPISAKKSINRFALIRKISWDKTGLFNARVWDGMARKAMIKIQLEDKAMLEQLKYDQLPAEFSVRADLPQVQFRKLRQQWAEMVGVVPTEIERPPYTVSNKDM
jgi:phenylpropionate dioxygenase-like ring-hydroxylating dioxygenase large terminal subunit